MLSNTSCTAPQAPQAKCDFLGTVPLPVSITVPDSGHLMNPGRSPRTSTQRRFRVRSRFHASVLAASSVAVPPNSKPLESLLGDPESHCGWIKRVRLIFLIHPQWLAGSPSKDSSGL